MPTTSDLSHAIDHALRDSLMLIVMCSPASAASQWVGEEIRAFKHLHGEDRILAIVIEGEPNATDKGAPEEECFPHALRYKVGPDGALTDERTEPIAADARPHGDGKDDALLKLLSGLLAVNFNDLKQREVQAARRRARVAQGIAGAMAVLAVAALGAGWFAYQNQQIAEEQRAEAITQRQIAEAETRRADQQRAVAEAQREIAEAQKRLAEDRLREALIERTGRAVADGRAAAAAGRAEAAMAQTLAALATASEIKEPTLTETATQLARDLLLDDRVEALLAGHYPSGLSLPVFGAAEVSPNGNAIMARRGNRLLVWRRLTGERLQRITGVAAAAFGQNGDVSGLLEGGQAFAISSDTGVASVIGGEAAHVRRAAITAYGDEVALVDDENLIVRSLRTGRDITVLAIDAQDTQHLSWSPDGRYLGAADFDPPRTRVWRVSDGAAIVDITPNGGVNRIRFNDEYTALIDADDEWRRVDLTTGSVTPLLAGERIDDAVFAADGHIIIDHALNPPLRMTPAGQAIPMGNVATYGVLGVRAEGTEVILRGSRQFMVRDVATGALIRQLGRPTGASPLAFHLSQSGDYLAILDDAGLVTVWSVNDGRETLALLPETPVTRLWMMDAPMGALLMLADGAGHLTMHRAEGAPLFSTDPFGIGPPLDGGVVSVLGGFPDPARLWDITTRHPVRDLPGPVWAQDNATGRLLTRLGGELAVSFANHDAPVKLATKIPRLVAATFGPNGRLAIQTPDALILFDTETGAELGTIHAIIDQMRAGKSVAFTPDGARLLLLLGHDLLLDVDATNAEVLRDVTLPSRADAIGMTASGETAIIAADHPLRYDLANGTMISFGDTAKMLVSGPHATIIGDGPEISVFDTATKALRFTRQGRGDAYAVGDADRIMLSHQARPLGTAEPDKWEARSVITGDRLWALPASRPAGLGWRKPALSTSEDWALATDLGPLAGYLVKTGTGQITAALPVDARASQMLTHDDALHTVVVQDGARADAFDLSSAQAQPADLIAMLRARTIQSPQSGEKITACDRAAAHPDDPMAITQGVPVEDIPFEAAEQCRKALASTGTGVAAARLTYQLSRALDAAGQSPEAVRMLERLAARGYPMADHALGIWRLGGVGGGPPEAAAHFRKAADGGVGAAWIVLARMAEAGMIEGDRDALLQEGAAAGSADALEALALSAAAVADMETAHRFAREAALAAAAHRRYRFDALAATLARRVKTGAWASQGDAE